MILDTTGSRIRETFRGRGFARFCWEQALHVDEYLRDFVGSKRCVWIHTCGHTYLLMHIHVHMSICIYVYVCKHKHIYIYTYILIYVYLYCMRAYKYMEAIGSPAEVHRNRCSSDSSSLCVCEGLFVVS